MIPTSPTALHIEASSLADWGARPRYAPSDFVTLLWRERWLMLGVFAAIALLGCAFAFTLNKSYEATSSVLVRLGQEYVYEPRAGDAARGAVPDVDQVIQSESEILNSGELRERTLRRVGLGRVYPELGAAYDHASPDQKALIMAKARTAMGRSLKIATAPANAIVRLSFQHKDPQVAVAVLNTLLEEYLVYRRTLLITPDNSIEKQQALFETRLASADAAYQGFLTSNDIGDFAAEKASLTQLQAQVESQRYAAAAQLQDRTARLATTERLLGQTAAEVGLYRDLSGAANDKLAQLRTEREGLLARYKPDAEPVKDIDVQIAQLEQGVASGRTQTDGARRLGVNPVFQTLQTDRNQISAETAALRQQVAAYDQQAKEINARLLRLAALEPQFTALSRDRDVLQSNVRDFSVKAQQDEAAREIADESSDNIRILQRAVAPADGKSLKKPVMILALLFAAFTALCAGLVRMFLRPGLQTPASASRTLQLPVLAAAGVKT